MQDSGGLFGFTLPMEMPERFKRLLVMNATIAGCASPRVAPASTIGKPMLKANPDFDVARLMRRTTPVLSEPEAVVDSAPFPYARYRRAYDAFPN